MRTVKQVSDLTGISVRMLHYYDEIGLLKPTSLNEARYRLYDDEALETLQQILFFKELEMPLKEVKKLMASPQFDKFKTLENQKKLLVLKRNRLNDLIELIDKTLKGENTMSFKEFDMSEYFNVLEEFKKDEDKVIKAYGSIDKYDEMIEKIKTKKDEIADMAVKQYGSIENYAKAVKQNLNSGILNLAKQYDEFKKDCLEDKNPKLKKLFDKLVEDLNKKPSAKEVQLIAEDIYSTVKNDYEIFRDELGRDNWYTMVKLYLVYPEWMNKIDDKYEKGASKFIGEALEINLGGQKPRLEFLNDKLVEDLTKAPSSSEIQKIIEEIICETKKSNEAYGVDQGDNYWSYMADQYLTNSIFKKVMDKKYKEGAASFMGKAIKVYIEKNKG